MIDSARTQVTRRSLRAAPTETAPVLPDPVIPTQRTRRSLRTVMPAGEVPLRYDSPVDPSAPLDLLAPVDLQTRSTMATAGRPPATGGRRALPDAAGSAPHPSHTSHAQAPQAPHTQALLSRRDLRAPTRAPAHATAHRRAVGPAPSLSDHQPVSSALRTRPAGVTPRAQRRRPVLPSAAVLVTLAVMIGGFAHAEDRAAGSRALAQQQRIAAAQAAQDAASAQAELARQTRVRAAESARLAAGAGVYAAARRTEALALARAAVESGVALVSTVAPVVRPEDLTTLGQAVSDLTALIDADPAPRDVLATQAARVAAASGRPPVPAGPAPRVDDDAAVLAVPPAAPAAPLPTDLLPAGAPAPAEGRSRDIEPQDPSAPATVVDAASTRAVWSPETSTAAATAALLAPPAPAVPAPAPVGAVPEGLDLDVTQQMVATAQHIAALSAEVQAVADANIAAAEAARVAAEEAAASAAAAKASARARTAEVARKVRLAEESANGAISRDALCGVSFDSGALLRCDAARPLEELNKAFRAHFGRNLDVSSSYRDFATQVLTKQLRGGLASAPGKSNHGRGLAVDFGGFGGGGQFDLPTYLWMKQHGPDYGWYHPPYMEPGGAGPFEPWHWEFGRL